MRKSKNKKTKTKQKKRNYASSRNKNMLDENSEKKCIY